MREYDDLSVISGIGPVRQRWLRDSLDVSTFRGLAMLSASMATEQLKADGHNIPAGELEKWIAAAQEKLREKPDSPKIGWQPFAAFVVEFQARDVADNSSERRTVAHYMEGDKEQVWSGLEGKELCRWILSNLGEYISTEVSESDVLEEATTEDEPSASAETATVILAEPDEATTLAVEEAELGARSKVEKAPLGRQPVIISVQQLRINQPSYSQTTITAGRIKKLFAGDILSDTLFHLEARFATQIEASNGRDLEQIGYHAEFYARDRSSGENLFLGESEQEKLFADKANYVTSLSELILPAGTYRIEVLVTVETSPPARGYLAAPLLFVN